MRIQDDLSDDAVGAAVDPSLDSNVNKFWEALAKGQRDIAVAAAAAIRAPRIVDEVSSSFPFGEGEQSRSSAAQTVLMKGV